MEKAEPVLGGISIEYSKFENIESDIVSILSKMKSTKWDTLDIEKIAVVFSKYMAKLWKIHPFREGNTRTIITFCCNYVLRSKLFHPSKIKLNQPKIGIKNT